MKLGRCNPEQIGAEYLNEMLFADQLFNNGGLALNDHANEKRGIYQHKIYVVRYDLFWIIKDVQ